MSEIILPLLFLLFSFLSCLVLFYFLTLIKSEACLYSLYYCSYSKYWDGAFDLTVDLLLWLTELCASRPPPHIEPAPLMLFSSIISDRSSPPIYIIEVFKECPITYYLSSQSSLNYFRIRSSSGFPLFVKVENPSLDNDSLKNSN